MFCVRPTKILMGEKNLTRRVLEAMAKCQYPYCARPYIKQINLC